MPLFKTCVTNYAGLCEPLLGISASFLAYVHSLEKLPDTQKCRKQSFPWQVNEVMGKVSLAKSLPERELLQPCQNKWPSRKMLIATVNGLTC